MAAGAATPLGSKGGPLVLGIDGGGTSTRVLVEPAAAPGVAVFRGQSGASNVLTTRPEQLQSTLERALRGAPAAAAVCGCFAGVIRDADSSRVKSLLSERFPGAKVFVEPDYAAAHFASEPVADFTVVAGTGSVVCWEEGGEIRKAGGGGYLLGDEGSGFWFGRKVLRAWLAGRIEGSSAVDAALSATFGSTQGPEILASLYSEPGPQKRMAKLGGLVGDAAKAGEFWAKEALVEGAALLADITAAPILRLRRPEPVRVSLSGGLWKTSPMFSAAFETALNQVLGERVAFRLEVLKRPPVCGAVEFARRRLVG
jgi:N-acetylglucosamine kinase-like BadF-type ATPase